MRAKSFEVVSNTTEEVSLYTDNILKIRCLQLNVPRVAYMILKFNARYPIKIHQIYAPTTDHKISLALQKI